jgi:hypothetical protein
VICGTCNGKPKVEMPKCGNSDPQGKVCAGREACPDLQRHWQKATEAENPSLLNCAIARAPTNLLMPGAGLEPARSFRSRGF